MMCALWFLRFLALDSASFGNADNQAQFSHFLRTYILLRYAVYQNYGGDDEQEELRVRFEAEGLRSDELTDAKKLVTVWRWLVDSETNVSSLRNQLDKLHKQQSAEMKAYLSSYEVWEWTYKKQNKIIIFICYILEVESYIEHIQSLFEEKVSRVQFDNRALRLELEQRGPSNEGQVAHIRRLLRQHCGVEGNSTTVGSSCHNGSTATTDSGTGRGTGQVVYHHDNNPNSVLSNTTLNDQMTLVEQIAFILAERDRLKEQLERQRERELRLEENRKLYNNLPQSMKLSANTSTVDGNVSEHDSDRSSASDSSESSSEGDYARIRSPPQTPPRTSRHSRIDNARRTQQGAQVGEDAVKRNIRDPGNIKPMIADKQWIKNLLQEGADSPTGDQGPGDGACDSTDTDETNANNRLQSRIESLADRLVAMEKTNRQLELDNETLGFKLSEALVQCDELEQRLRASKEQHHQQQQQAKDKTSALVSMAAGLNECGAGSRSQPESPVKQSFMQTLDNRWLSAQDAGLMEHCKKLHKEVVSLQDQLYQTSQKLEALTVRYQDKKIKHQERMHTLREQHQLEVARLGERIDGLLVEVRALRDEKKNLLKSLLEREGGLVTRAPDAPPKDAKDIKDTAERPEGHSAQPIRL
ncbi:hypothetical protein BIW11_11182 [Tropilaelaps mercedesae]|uniref:Uncharacterized protein n=1 Tax=Tropilaelaps mercedesae TaxID=418985 RepID=A0A1V9XC65_9ACAR|nr:hypothetical protein BIW11_11182 [Tropilaelaps mercedesae]